MEERILRTRLAAGSKRRIARRTWRRFFAFGPAPATNVAM
jgi:hypothetical protein